MGRARRLSKPRPRTSARERGRLICNARRVRPRLRSLLCSGRCNCSEGLCFPWLARQAVSGSVARASRPVGQ
eukprot:7492711-Alexandrium_andersonii.AAC.1